jgi:hypothetical protein
MKELINIQHELKCKKVQYNNFGKYNFRSLEDILEAVKPILKANSCHLHFEDELVQMGESTFYKAVAMLENTDKDVIVGIAFAKHAIIQKGMQDAQISGSTMSYARKYALGGLFLLDDSENLDSNEQTEKESLPVDVIKHIATIKTVEKLGEFYKLEKSTYKNCSAEFNKVVTAKKIELGGK